MAADGTMTVGFVCINQIIIVYALERLNWKKPRIQKKGLYTVSEDGVEYRFNGSEEPKKQGVRMRPEVQSVYNRQVARCLSDIDEVHELPCVVEDRIKKAIEYTCKDVDKLRLKPVTRNGETDEDYEQRFNR